MQQHQQDISGQAAAAAGAAAAVDGLAGLQGVPLSAEALQEAINAAAAATAGDGALSLSLAGGDGGSCGAPLQLALTPEMLAAAGAVLPAAGPDGQPLALQVPVLVLPGGLDPATLEALQAGSMEALPPEQQQALLAAAAAGGGGLPLLQLDPGDLALAAADAAALGDGAMAWWSEAEEAVRGRRGGARRGAAAAAVHAGPPRAVPSHPLIAPACTPHHHTQNIKNKQELVQLLESADHRQAVLGARALDWASLSAAMGRPQQELRKKYWA